MIFTTNSRSCHRTSSIIDIQKGVRCSTVEEYKLKIKD